jgi:hypothetical protein
MIVQSISELADLANVSQSSVQTKLEDIEALLFISYPSLLPIRSKLFIAGGCIRSMILEEEVKDIDIFCKDELTVAIVKESISGFRSDNALNLYIHPYKVQIVTTEAGSPIDIINQFDFTMNMNYYDFESKSIEVLHLTDIIGRNLKVNKNCRNKLGTLARIVKFVNRGYKLDSKENLLELGCQISRMESIDTFEELEKESKLYFSNDEYYNIDYVVKTVVSNTKFESRRQGSGL